MIRLTSAVAGMAMLFASSTASYAVTFTPDFSTPTFPGTQFDVTPAFNAVYSADFGITVENAYLYKDARDTFDGIGIANGFVADIGTPQSGRVNFLDTTDFVDVDYFSIRPTTYAAFSASNVLIDSFASVGTNGTDTLSGGLISYILFTSDGGFGTISGLTYNFDGTTDGVNDDIKPPVSTVPLPAGGVLLLTALFGLGIARRRAS